jgi:hypothetical protein
VSGFADAKIPQEANGPSGQAHAKCGNFALSLFVTANCEKAYAATFSPVMVKMEFNVLKYILVSWVDGKGLPTLPYEFIAASQGQSSPESLPSFHVIIKVQMCSKNISMCSKILYQMA